MDWSDGYSLVVTFVSTMIFVPKPSYAEQGVIGLPKPGTMVNLSSSYVPLMITGLSVHPENPLLMDFIVSTGNSGLNADQVKKESDRLIKYFLACLTIPENDQWVNLSPYEKQRIVPEDLGQTVLGQDMLAQDYILKQLTASLIYPEKNFGKIFWDKVYAKAREEYGTAQIPVNTFNKVWILPDTAKVYTHHNTVFVVKSHLKVMLDEDYLSLQKHSVKDSSAMPQNDVHALASSIIRQIVIPAIEQEVNTGRNFSQLRQIYNSMILAVWFKKNLKQALLNQVYSDKSKVNGVNVDDPAIKQRIYKQYLQAYKKGVFNYIKEDLNQSSQQPSIPRKYFSGGITPVKDLAMATVDEAVAAIAAMPIQSRYYTLLGKTTGSNGSLFEYYSNLNPENPDGYYEPAGISSLNNHAMVTQEKIQLGIDYLAGLVKTKPKLGPIRASKKDDVESIANKSHEELMRLEKIGIEALPKGTVILLAGGQSSRQPLEDVPQKVTNLAHRAGITSFKSKFEVPIGEHLGTVITFGDFFFRNLSRYLKQVGQEIGNGGAKGYPNVLICSHPDFESSQEAAITKHGRYGLPVDVSIGFFNTNPVPVLSGRVADVEALHVKKKFKNQKEYEGAKAVAEEVEEQVRQGNKEAVIVEGQLDGGGHGEIWPELILSGQLLKMLEQKKKWFFVRNIDNAAAKFDSRFSQILGRFIEQGIDFQPEVSPRAPAAVGGSLIVMEDSKRQELIEDPTLRATVGADGVTPKVKPDSSYWFNNATGLFTPEFAASLALKEGQTVQDFIAEYKRAWDEKDYNPILLQEIADRVRTKIPVMFDPKVAKIKDSKGRLRVYAKEDRNMWQATGVVPETIKEDVDHAPRELKIQAIGVEAVNAFPSMQEFFAMSLPQKWEVLRNSRFAPTKEWNISEDRREKEKTNLIIKKGGEDVTPQELGLTLGTYEDNDKYGVYEYTIEYVEEAPLVTPGVLSGKTNPAMHSINIQDLAMTVDRAREIIESATVVQRPRPRSLEDNGKEIWGLQLNVGTDLLTNFSLNDLIKGSGLTISEDGFVPIGEFLPAESDINREADRTRSRLLSVLPNESHSNAAMAVESNPGGIDLNSKTLNMQSEGQSIDIAFDPAMIAQFKRGDFSGIRIQILGIDLVNPMSLLGLKE